MRVGIDVSPLTRVRTGVGTYCLYLVKYLLGLGSDLDLVGFSAGLRPIEKDIFEGRLPQRRLPVPARLLYELWPLLKAPKVDTFLGGVDIYHATNFFLPPTRAARRVVTIHDLSFLAVPELCSPKIVGPFAAGIGRFVREADAVLACSEAMKREMVERLDITPEKITVAPEAVSEDFKPMEREAARAYVAEHYGLDGPFLLYLGTLEPRKNIVGLVQAFEQILDEIPHTLVLLGPMGWKTEEIEAAMASPNLKGRLRRVGYVASHSELPAFYSAADLFVFPTFYEGFGLPILEAMACGCPVVTSNNSSVPEVTGGAAEYADPHDAADIARSMRKVLDDKLLRDSMAARGLEHAAGFSWEKCARITLDVYREVSGC